MTYHSLLLDFTCSNNCNNCPETQKVACMLIFKCELLNGEVTCVQNVAGVYRGFKLVNLLTVEQWQSNICITSWTVKVPSLRWGSVSRNQFQTLRTISTTLSEQWVCIFFYHNEWWRWRWHSMMIMTTKINVFYWIWTVIPFSMCLQILLYGSVDWIDYLCHSLQVRYFLAVFQAGCCERSDRVM